MNLHYKKKQKKCLSALAVTDVDLGCDMGLNFLFGLACPTNSVCCSSIHRQVPSFTGEEFDTEQEAYDTVLIRACKVAAHELGHTLGLLHCIYYECAMNGSNGLENTDSRPLSFCPVCYRKLHYSLNFDHVKRYKALVDVCEKL